MASQKKWFLVHRWLALVVSLQLLAWSVGGFVFSILDIESVRGNTDRVQRAPQALDVDKISLTPRQAITIASSHGCGDASEILIRERLGDVVFEFYKSDDPLCAVDANSGLFLAMISEDEAKGIALRDFEPDATVLSTMLITEDPPQEYRGGLLPAYQVILDHSHEPHIYVSAITGNVTKRRNSRWRMFDFFWMLHIMDYRDRDNFNHWLLTAMSVLAIVTSLTGLVLWSLRIRWLRFRENG